ncbi:MAG: nucleotidyltransferase family protein [Methylococcaceae bacterium]
MNRQQAIETLTKHKPELIKRFGITRLAVFGSTVRNEAKPESDIDIIVDFDGPATSKQYFGMQFYLEEILATPQGGVYVLPSIATKTAVITKLFLT